MRLKLPLFCWKFADMLRLSSCPLSTLASDWHLYVCTWLHRQKHTIHSVRHFCLATKTLVSYFDCVIMVLTTTKILLHQNVSFSCQKCYVYLFLWMIWIYWFWNVYFSTLCNIFHLAFVFYCRKTTYPIMNIKNIHL